MEKNFNQLKNNLSESDIEQILKIVCYKCSEKTKKRVESCLKYSASLIPSYGILERLTCETGIWDYTTGLSYLDEMRLIRKAITGERL
jgi:hypothetical protein